MSQPGITAIEEPLLITVRLATLEDTAAITAIHRSHRTEWNRLDSAGRSMVVPYDELTLYERWLEAGPWASIETCAVHLNRQLSGSGFPLVAEVDGAVRATAEVYEGYEPPPYGHHLHLAVLMTHADHVRHGLGTALINYVLEMARLMKCERITISNPEAPDFYTQKGFRHTRSGHRVRIPAQSGRAFYQATALTERAPEQVKSWFMPLGRYQSSRQEWENLFPQSWAAGVPEMLNAATMHLKLTVTGQNAILFMREADQPGGQPGEVHLACWSARPLSNPLLTAIRDRANRDVYQTIITYATDADIPLLGGDVQQTDDTRDFYELAV
jgi:GNAT superfamily N-acetyltransferase